MTSPPMISADPTDGKMRLVLPDMMATFTAAGHAGREGRHQRHDRARRSCRPRTATASRSSSARPTSTSTSLDDIANDTRLSNDDLSAAIELALDARSASISALLGGIPLPAMAGLQMTNLSIDADDGYVMVKGTLQ